MSNWLILWIKLWKNKRFSSRWRFSFSSYPSIIFLINYCSRVVTTNIYFRSLLHSDVSIHHLLVELYECHCKLRQIYWKLTGFNQVVMLRQWYEDKSFVHAYNAFFWCKNRQNKTIMTDKIIKMYEKYMITDPTGHMWRKTIVSINTW